MKDLLKRITGLEVGTISASLIAIFPQVDWKSLDLSQIQPGWPVGIIGLYMVANLVRSHLKSPEAVQEQIESTVNMHISRLEKILHDRLPKRVPPPAPTRNHLPPVKAPPEVTVTKNSDYASIPSPFQVDYGEEELTMPDELPKETMRIQPLPSVRK